jgi:hypothetical protein
MTATPWDEWAGMEKGHLTPHARRLVVLAGTSWSFDMASARLKEFCGLSISDQTIRRETEGVGQKAAAWQRTAPEPVESFQQAEGQKEFYTDGTCINTREGWREMRAGVFAKRSPGPPTEPAQWRDRILPAPNARMAFCEVTACAEFGNRWTLMGERLGLSDGEGLSVLADGAKWIWHQVRQRWPRSECVVDVFHVSEHLHDCGRVLHGEGTQASRQWAEQQVETLVTHHPVAVVKTLEQQETATTDEPQRRALASLRGYLTSRLDGLWYRDRLRRGLPIGSGLIEGVCKTVIGRRFKHSGARWLVPNANSIGALCCLLYNDHWNRFWELN